MNNIDYSLLRGRIILFCSVLIVSALLLWFSFSQLTQQEQIMVNTQSDMDYAEEEIDRLNNLVSLFENFNNDYKKYEAKGFLNEEQRLSWIETLEKTAGQLRLDNLRYEITPRQTVSNDNKGLPPNITLFESKLTLESGLVHEGDLIHLISNLSQLKSGLFVVDNCKVQRMDTTTVLASSSNFNAKCSTSWYTANYEEQTNDYLEEEL
jgi:phage-related protein